MPRNSEHWTKSRIQGKPSSWSVQLGDRLYQAGTSATGQPLIRPEPHAGQRLFLDCNHPRRLLVAHRRFGKDWATVMDILRRIERWKEGPLRRQLEPAIHIGVIYPTYELVDDFWGALKRMTPRSEVANCRDTKPQRLTLRCGAVIAVRTASDPDLLVSRGYDLVILGEAARMSRDAWLTVLPALASPGRAGMAVHQTTPLGRNWIAREAQDPSWWQLVVPIWEPDSRERHPLANPYISQEAILEEERQLPERWFRQEWLVDFLSAQGAMFRDVRAHVASPPATPRPPIVVGVDLAKRADFTVFAAFDADGRMVAFDRMGGIPYGQQSQRLCSFIREVSASRVIIETNGPGEAFLDMVEADAHEAQLNCEFEGMATTATSKEQMINALAVAFERADGITLLDDPVLVNEFEAFSASQLPSGRERLSAPEGGFDDCVMACALAFSAVQRERATEFPPGMFPKAEDWRRFRKRSWAEGLGVNLRQEWNARRSMR